MTPPGDGAQHDGTPSAPAAGWWDRWAAGGAGGDTTTATPVTPVTTTTRATSSPAPGAGAAAVPATRAAPGSRAVREVRDLESLVAWKGPQLVRLAQVLLRDEHQAEDVVQDVLATCVLKWNRIRAVDDPSAYLNRMLVNAVTSSHRRPWRRERPSDPADLPEQPLDDPSGPHAERQRSLALLRRLPDKQRVVLVLRLYEGLPDAEIADLAGCSPATVRSNAHRGLATLRRLLAEEGVHRA